MRLILYPKVYSDIDEIMEYYEGLLFQAWLTSFTRSYGVS
jgi:hypothetical protein